MICETYEECRTLANYGRGFDYDNPDGYPDDETECLEAGCTFRAAGAYAEHAALHHWVQTRHRWRLRTHTNDRSHGII